MKKPSLLSVIIYVAVIGLLLAWMLGVFSPRVDDLSYSQVVELFRKEQVKSFTVDNGMIELNLHEAYSGKTSLVCELADTESFRREMWDTIQAQHEAGELESFEFLPEEKTTPFDYVLPLIQGEPELPKQDSLPRFCKLKKILAK